MLGVHLILSLLLIFTGATLWADDYAHLEKEIKRQKKSLKEWKACAKEMHSKKLLRAILATKKIKKEFPKLSLNTKALLQTSLFIESRLPALAKTEEYFLPKEKTGLQYDVEFDPNHKTRFIVLEGKEAYIGAGAFKVVHKAIQYHHKSPQIVARAVERTDKKRERQITELMHGKPGIFETVGFGEFTKDGKTYSIIYSKLYSPGSLQDALDYGYKLSSHEKMQVAYELLQGLKALHKTGIVHRDLGARNYLIDIPEGKPDKRNVTACISDLGRATYAKDAGNTKVQGNTTYTAPEGLYKEKLQGKDYYKTDVFAVGCVLYRLFYGKKAPWQEVSYVKATEYPLYFRYKELKHHVEKYTKARRTRLAKKHSRTAKEEFELLILKMLHTKPTLRPTANQLEAKMKKIVKSDAIH